MSGEHGRGIARLDRDFEKNGFLHTVEHLVEPQIVMLTGRFEGMNLNVMRQGQRVELSRERRRQDANPPNDVACRRKLVPVDGRRRHRPESVGARERPPVEEQSQRLAHFAAMRPPHEVHREPLPFR